MRVLLAVGMTAALALVACGGCSSTQMPSFPTFGLGGKSKPKASKLSNAPPGPELNSMAGTTTPNVSMPPSSAWSNLPVYPGTNYQQTPYPDPAIASAAPAYSSNAATAPITTAPTANPGTSGYASNYAAMPPAESVGPSSPYTAYPATGGQPPPSSAQQVPTYSPPRAASYAPQAAAPYAQGQTPAYGGQQVSPYAAAQPSYAQQPPPPNARPASPFAGQQTPPYSAPQDPYGATSEPYNAANPYGSYTR